MSQGSNQNGWKQISRERVFENPWRPVDRLRMRRPDGGEGDYFFNMLPDVVCVFPVTKTGKVVINNQFHILMQERQAQLCAGMIDEGEDDPLVTAKRELLEETGYASEKWTFLQKIVLSSWASNFAYIYLAQECGKVADQDLEPSEDIEIVEMEMSEFEERLRNGRIETVLSAFAGFAGLDYLRKRL